MIGTRGVPARYGGAETFAEELATRLAARGHDITVYCWRGNDRGRAREYKGVRLVYVPGIPAKVFGSVSYGFFGLLHAALCHYDCLHVFNVGNAPLCVLPRLLGRKIVMMTDGLDWQRRKWGRMVRWGLQFGEYVATKVATELIADARAMQRYYLARYGASSVFIPYGAHIDVSRDPTLLAEYGLEPGRYFFVVTRLEPENNTDLTIKAFERLATDHNLVIVGSAGYKSRFVEELMRTRDPRIRFLPPIYDRAILRELFCNAYAYVHGNEVGGTNPALLQAMGYGCAVLAVNVVFNAEVLRDTGILYEKSVDALREQLEYVTARPDLAAELRRRAVRRIREAYTWEGMTDEYERLFVRVISGKELVGPSRTGGAVADSSQDGSTTCASR